MIPNPTAPIKMAKDLVLTIPVRIFTKDTSEIFETADNNFLILVKYLFYDFPLNSETNGKHL